MLVESYPEQRESSWSVNEYISTTNNAMDRIECLVLETLQLSYHLYRTWLSPFGDSEKWRKCDRTAVNSERANNGVQDIKYQSRNGPILFKENCFLCFKTRRNEIKIIRSSLKTTNWNWMAHIWSLLCPQLVNLFFLQEKTHKNNIYDNHNKSRNNLKGFWSAVGRGVRARLGQIWNVFVQNINSICLDCKMYLFNLEEKGFWSAVGRDVSARLGHYPS